MNSLIKKKGIGRDLVEKVKKFAKEKNCKRVWLIITNDNIDALAFWQKSRICFKSIYPDAISFSQKLKPEIPEIGNYGIPIRDEIELEFKIKK